MELKHWKLNVDADHLAWLAFDRAGASTNTLSSEVLRELGQIADHLASMPPKGLAILSAKENGFVAGADIDEFTTLRDADEAMAFVALGNEVFDKIAALPFPTLALIHGFCMGGGTELALACKYRVMDDGPKTRMALPEVMLGIVPGWGAAKRMPKLIGAAAALDLMLTGRGVDGRRAKKMGLVDAVTPRRHFENAGRMILNNPPALHHPTFHAGGARLAGIRDIVAKMSARQVAKRVRRDQYPAPYAIIDLWKDFDGDPRKIPRDHPASTASLFFHPTAKNLIRIFKLQERLKSLGKSGTDPEDKDDKGPVPKKAPARHRRGRHGRRHRRVGGAARRDGDAAGSRARSHRAGHQARGRALQEAPQAAAPGPGGARSIDSRRRGQWRERGRHHHRGHRRERRREAQGLCAGRAAHEGQARSSRRTRPAFRCSSSRRSCSAPSAS